MLNDNSSNLNDRAYPISSFETLYADPTFQWLCRLQAAIDQKEHPDSKTTRTPIHTIAFLIAFAAADKNRHHEKLTTYLDSLCKGYKCDTCLDLADKLEKLIKDIDWSIILNIQTEGRRYITISSNLKVPNKNAFLEAISKNAPESNLKSTLDESDCEFRIVANTNSDEIEIKTTVTQKNQWKEKFDKSNGKYLLEDYWNVGSDCFLLDKEILDTVKGLSTGSHQLGGFWVEKDGECTDQTPIKLKISNNRTEQDIKIKEKKEINFDSLTSDKVGYNIEEEIKNSGIYHAFLNLQDYAGLTSVDKVKVTLENKANFTRTGIDATSDQVVVLQSRGFQPVSKITINVESVYAYLPGIDMQLLFSEKPESTEINSDDKDKKYKIILLTKEGVKVELHSAPYSHKEIVEKALSTKYPQSMDVLPTDLEEKSFERSSKHSKEGYHNKIPTTSYTSVYDDYFSLNSVNSDDSGYRWGDTTRYEGNTKADGQLNSTHPDSPKQLTALKKKMTPQTESMAWMVYFGIASLSGLFIGLGSAAMISSNRAMHHTHTAILISSLTAVAATIFIISMSLGVYDAFFRHDGRRQDENNSDTIPSFIGKKI
jgi:hypothetical protein